MSALVLILVVFPGATESVITGSALLAFGFGWAMMRVLSARMTSHPQRWATIPAVAMTATGAGLLVFSPQDATLSTLNWVWPPAMLALAGWMFVQMRRAVPGRGRWLLTPVVVFLAVASIGATAENVVADRIESTYPAPGKTYAVGDHRLHLDCQGTGGPTVVLFNGMGEFSASWARITDPVSTTTRVCAYDRAGQGWSDDVSEPPGRRDRRPGPPRPPGRGRRTGAVRLGRALHRRPLRHDLRRDLPRAGRRHGPPGQLQPLPVHRSPRLPDPVRLHAARPGSPAHAGTRGRAVPRSSQLLAA